MSSTFAVTEAATFTVTHARHLAAKVATDLKRMQRFYGSPSDVDIDKYEVEMVELLKGGYVHSVTYGFQRDEKWIEPTLRYTARELVVGSSVDDDPGKVRPGASVVGAKFGSYLIYTSTWHDLSSTARDVVKSLLPFQRAGAGEPGIHGYLASDLTYVSGSRSLSRSTVRSL